MLQRLVPTIWNTVFSTIYIAKNFRTGYHTDSGNLRGVMTAMMPMGKFTGGELILARWRIAIAYKPGDFQRRLLPLGKNRAAVRD